VLLRRAKSAIVYPYHSAAHLSGGLFLLEETHLEGGPPSLDSRLRGNDSANKSQAVWPGAVWGLLKKVFEEQIEYVLMYTCKQNEIIHSMR